MEECWKFMTALVRRGEFMLANVGFDSKDRLEMMENFNREICKEK